MKFIFFGYDYTLDIAIACMERGHELIGIYTFPCDNIYAFNKQTLDFARYHDISMQESPMMPDDVDHCLARGARLFFSAGYPYKIPPVEAEKAYAVNMHPSLLPRARGMMPMPHIILNEPQAAGFTLHKMTPAFDEGDILYQEAVELGAHTDVETLSARIAIRAHVKIPDIIDSLAEYWAQANPQDEAYASLAALPDEAFRTLDWGQSAQSIEHIARALGRFGMIAYIKNNVGQSQKLAVFQLSAWGEKHDLPVGVLLRSSSREIVLSIKDGYVCLKDFIPLQDNTQTKTEGS